MGKNSYGGAANAGEEQLMLGTKAGVGKGPDWAKGAACPLRQLQCAELAEGKLQKTTVEEDTSE